MCYSRARNMLSSCSNDCGFVCDCGVLISVSLFRTLAAMEPDVGPLHRGIVQHVSSAPSDSASIAAAVLASCDAITAALVPIVGQQGASAMLFRSVQLARAGHPWIAQAQPPTGMSIDLDALHTAIEAQTTTQAKLGGIVMLSAFCDLLRSLIGASLTTRLLDGVWPPPRGGDLTQDDPE
jgi:hypothetical protein